MNAPRIQRLSLALFFSFGIAACGGGGSDPGAEASDAPDASNPDTESHDTSTVPDTTDSDTDAGEPDTAEPDVEGPNDVDSDGGPVDGGPPQDFGPDPKCVDDEDCDDGDPCTKDSCTDAGVCHNLGIPGCEPCLGEGEGFEDFDTAGKCCPGLSAVTACVPAAGGGCACPNCPCHVCTKCGDGACGTGENACNCAKDCKEPTPSQCTAAGGTCVPNDLPVPVEMVCPVGTAPAPYDGCAGGELCCAPPYACIPAGGKMDATTGFAKCCDGLAEIPYPFSGPPGTCTGTGDVMICSACGDGLCDPWENPCNCYEDCEPEDACYGPLDPCPLGQYCKNLDGMCDVLGVNGTCVDVPFACDTIYEPVCGCDGKTYASECVLEAAMVSMDYAAECMEGCFGSGDYWDGKSPPGCCPGLGLLAPCKPSMGACFCDDVAGGVCSDCGDGLCDGGLEDVCNCPKDCGDTPMSPCEEKGGFCTAPVPDPGGGGCFEGTSPADLPGCTPGELCCVPGAGECVPEGETTGDWPGAMPCCEGLVAIDVSEPVDGPEGTMCMGEVGVVFCSKCGNGFCEAGWENVCNCKKDCAGGAGTVCKPGGSECEEGQYCMFAPGKCLASGSYGVCTPVPAKCPDADEPVCGCDGSTYLNECEMQMSETTKAYDGECVEGCYTLGESFLDFEPEGLCCPGLVAVSDCKVMPSGCSCPKCPCYVCAACGDGICDPAVEHQCNCPKDCPPKPPIDCEKAGGFCAPADPAGPGCPDGTAKLTYGLCPPGAMCCVKGPPPPLPPPDPGW